ncbi:MAG: DUF488 domain-containing protein [Pelagimonas sp.]|jgi:uncharacterized protein (DUF488 family)|nr:DUF488 domain-containing protein [Pelagimonas sp.]
MFDSQDHGNGAELMTIGYEGSTISDFVATLRAAGVQCLVDVRELPLSRKKGFSKNALREALSDAGIRYEHFKKLGDPKPGRDAARAGDYATFRKIFSEHLDTEDAQLALDSVTPIVLNGGACLLCFERSHKECHRSMVANELIERTGVKVRHIGVRQGIAGELVG